jgi:hypothetical protein
MDQQLEDESTPSPMETPKQSKRIYCSKQSQHIVPDTGDESSGDNNLPAIQLIRTKEYSNVNKIADRDHLTDENWHEWKDRMKRVFTNCDITGYITDATKRLNEVNDPEGAHNWDKNDSWAQQVIIHNVTSSQMNHIGSKTTAEAMYSALTVTHKNKAHQTVKPAL